MRHIAPPKEGEYAPYAIMYIKLVPDDGRVLEHMQDNLAKVREMFASLSEEKLTERFAENEWTIKEILVHVIDDERIYAYRALAFARNDTTELPGFEQDPYVANSGANDRSIESILDEYDAVRRATINLFEHLPEEAFDRVGTANHHRMSVRGALYHLAGHEIHHLNSMKENYL